VSGVIIDVDPADFVVAAASSCEVAVQISAARSALGAALARTPAMAGDDPSGRAWARSYDAAVGDAFAGFDALETSFRKISAGLAVTGYNYAAADWMSAGNVGDPPGHGVPAIPVTTCSAPPPSAAGGTGSPNFPGWAAVAAAVGEVWPDGDTARLRAAAAGWSAAAEALSSVAAVEGTRVSAALVDTRTPEIPTILSTIDSAVTGMARLSEASAHLAQACISLADEIDEVHRESLHEVVEMVAEIGGAFIVGAVLTPITAGVSDAISAAAAGSRVVIAVERILAFIARLAARAESIAARVTVIGTRVGTVVRVPETITVRIMTISGRVVVNGGVGAATNVVATAIADPGTDLCAAAADGFVAGGTFGEALRAGGLSGRFVVTKLASTARAATLRESIPAWSAARSIEAYRPYGGMTETDWYDRFFKGVDELGRNSWVWPTDNGFEPGTSRTNTLRVADRIERTSAAGKDGYFATSVDTPFEMLSMPPDRLSPDFVKTRYEVVRPLGPEVLEGVVAPHFGQPGGAVQYYFPEAIQPYVDAGFLKVVN
jgi:hypothetical protein